MGLSGTIVAALWAMLPAYLPNSAAVVFGGGPPIDGGRTWQGRRLLGDGKTWRGTLGGWGVGIGLAVVLNRIAPTASDVLGIGLPTFPLGAALALPLGAMAGDIGASFLKRRIGRTRGQPVPGLDQLDFVVGALVCCALVSPRWFAEVFTPVAILAVLVVTPALHLGTNLLGYALGLKAEPW